MNRLMICGMTSTRDTKSILKAIGGIVEADTMLRMLHDCKSRVEGAPSGLAITLDECPLSRKFAYNFTGWLGPANFEQAGRVKGLTTPASTDDRKDPATAPPPAPYDGNRDDDDRDDNDGNSDDDDIIPLHNLLHNSGDGGDDDDALITLADLLR